LDDVQSIRCMPDPQASLVDAVVDRAARALFDAYGLGVSVVRSSATPAATRLPPALVSVIDYSSPELNGSVLLALPESILLRTAPTSDLSHTDWAAELANQLLGRIKNQLLAHGVAIQLGLPAVVDHCRLASVPEDGDTRHYQLETEAGPILARVHVVLSPGFSLLETPEDAGAAEEGELVLF